MLPFLEEKISENIYERIFFSEDLEEFVWHQDQETRLIALLEGDGWYIQLDNSFPVEMKKNELYRIPARYWHRIIPPVGENKKCKLQIQKIFTS
jgi:hypothetical protein